MTITDGKMINKVCIPTAGLEQDYNLSKGLDKSLVEINNKPAIVTLLKNIKKNRIFNPIGIWGK